MYRYFLDMPRKLQGKNIHISTFGTFYMFKNNNQRDNLEFSQQ